MIGIAADSVLMTRFGVDVLCVSSARIAKNIIDHIANSIIHR
jgi:hypothetical protein